ncbi:MAG: 50S ribosomal protein L19e [Candidatus Thermoplasmatota archaeon]|nr:50S ribosomal protein L19e [Candidatus Thermoplasmatota archaeon]
MDLKTKKRLAADMLGCGLNRVYIDPSAMEEVFEAVTREDIRFLIDGGVIKAKQKQGISRGRARHTAQQKKKGKRIGPGSRKGSRYARLSKKQRWIRTIRPIRRSLREMREGGQIDSKTYREYYNLSKGGMFKNKTHMKTQLEAVGKLKGGK